MVRGDVAVCSRSNASSETLHSSESLHTSALNCAMLASAFNCAMIALVGGQTLVAKLRSCKSTGSLGLHTEDHTVDDCTGVRECESESPKCWSCWMVSLTMGCTFDMHGTTIVTPLSNTTLFVRFAFCLILARLDAAGRFLAFHLNWSMLWLALLPPSATLSFSPSRARSDTRTRGE